MAVSYDIATRIVRIVNIYGRSHGDTARALVAEGAHVVLAARRVDRGDALAS